MVTGLLFTALVLIPLILRLDAFPILPKEIEIFRLTKEFLSIAFAGAIGLTALYKGNIKPIKNYWLLVLLFMMMIHRFIGPSYRLDVLNANIGAFWIYQPLSYALIYFLMFVAIASHDWNIRLLSKIMGWVGFIAAAYLLMQHFGLDQFQEVIQIHSILASDAPALSSTLCHYNYSGAFIAMCLPFAILNKWWIRVAAMITAVVLATGQMAMGMAGIVLAGFLFYRVPKAIKILMATIGVGAAGFIIKNINTIMASVADNGRFEYWGKIIEKTLSEYAITGYTLGAYRYIFVNEEQGAFLQAHNAILEFFYNMGIPLTILFIIATGWFLIKSIPYLKDEETFTVSLCFLAIFAGSLGLFLYQIDPHRFYSVAILGLIVSQIRKGEQSCVKK